MSTKPAIPATVTQFTGSMALVVPDDVALAPVALKQGHWIPRKALQAGDKGTLTWFSSASFGNWFFQPV